MINENFLITKKAGPSTQMQYIASVDGEWMKPETLDDLLAVLDTIENGIKYQLVAGNSGKGNTNLARPFKSFCIND